MDILKRSLAPIVQDAWNEIDEQARTTIKQVLAGRRVVDVKGPMGWEFNAAPNGTISLAEETPVEGVTYGIRDVLPLVEYRVPFTMPMWDLDDISRGCKTVDFAPVQDAARKAALFEDTAVFQGLEEAWITGLEIEAGNAPINMEFDDESIIEALAHAVQTMADQNVEGPFAFVCPLPLWTKIQTSTKVYPLKKRIAAIIGEESRIVLSSQYPTAMLISVRGGDTELTVGQDFSVGYQSHTNTDVNFYITGSFTFRVLAPEAILQFTLPDAKKPAKKAAAKKEPEKK